jgi:hypothetical protein
VAATAGATLHSLQLDPATGQLSAGASLGLSQQASALGLFTLPTSAMAATSTWDSGSSSSSRGSGTCSLVGVGTWVDNSVQLLQQGSLAQVARLELGAQQARSIVSAVLSGAALLLVGTISGQVGGPRCLPAA